MIDTSRIWSSSSLPTLPTVAVRLLELSRDPEAGLSDVLDTVRCDPAIATKIVKAANSSFYGLRSDVPSIERAVPLLGMSGVTSLALGFSLVEDSMRSGSLAEYYRFYWTHSLVQASAAEILGRSQATGRGSEYFLCGLLLDIGRLAMLKTVGQEYRAVVERAREDRRPLLEVEAELLGIDHVQVGSELVERWKLPAALAAPIRHHHAELPEIEALRGRPEYDAVAACCVAAAAAEYYCTTNNGPALQRLRDTSAALFGTNEERLQKFLVDVHERVEGSGDVLQVEVDDLGQPSELMAAACEHLSQLALREATQRNAIELQNRELETRNRELADQAFRDPLTSLYNRRYFEEALQNDVERSRREGRPAAVVFLDVDRFKQLNDEHGHAFGDEVLARVAQTLRETVRKSDTVARYGGEEIVVLVHQPTEKGLQQLCELLRSSVESLRLECEGTPVSVTVSVGAAMALPSRMEDDVAERLLESADEAMYEAKRNGRNQVRVRTLLNDKERMLVQAANAARFSHWLVREGILQPDTVTRALGRVAHEHTRLGVFAERHGMLSESDVERVIAGQEVVPRLRFGEIALELKLLNRRQLAFLLAVQQESPEELIHELILSGALDPKSAPNLIEKHRRAVLDAQPADTVTAE